MDNAAHYLHNARFELRRLKRLAERAIDQVPDDAALHHVIDEESNSLAVLFQHLSGNMRSRWTDFLTSDGEKPDRHRDREFEAQPERSRAELMEAWELGWSLAFEALEALIVEDLGRTIEIRGEPHTVLEAIQRQISHTSYHVGQIVFLAKHLSAERWSSLSIPRGKSESAPRRYKS